MSGNVDMFQVRYWAFKHTPFGDQIFPKRFRMDNLGLRAREFIYTSICFGDPTESLNNKADSFTIIGVVGDQFLLDRRVS